MLSNKDIRSSTPPKVSSVTLSDLPFLDPRTLRSKRFCELPRPTLPKADVGSTSIIERGQVGTEINHVRKS